MTIRSITAVGPNGHFILATEDELWMCYAERIDTYGNSVGEPQWKKIELPKELKVKLTKDPEDK